MRQRFTRWYVQKYHGGKGPWWVELLYFFLWSPSVYCIEMVKKMQNEMVRINVYSQMNPDIDFDISVPRKYLNKVIKLIPKCGQAWYDYDGFDGLGWTEPLRMALDKLGINYIYHGVNTDPVSLAEVCVTFV